MPVNPDCPAPNGDTNKPGSDPCVIPWAASSSLDNTLEPKSRVVEA